MKKDNKKIAAVLAVAFFSSANSWVNPVMQLITEAFSNVSPGLIRQVSTLPALITMITLLFVGALVGKKFRYVPVVTFGLLCILVGGCLPVFAGSSFSFLMFSRVIMGIGVGCIGIRNALVIRSFEEPLQTKVLGLVILVINIGSVLTQQLSGFLGSLGWKYAFCIYFTAVLPIIFINIWFEEPPKEAVSGKNVNKKGKKLLSPRVLMYIFVIFGVMLCMEKNGLTYEVLSKDIDEIIKNV